MKIFGVTLKIEINFVFSLIPSISHGTSSTFSTSILYNIKLILLLNSIIIIATIVVFVRTVGGYVPIDWHFTIRSVCYGDSLNSWNQKKQHPYNN